MRKQLEDGRFSDPNGTFEEKYLHYFYAHKRSEDLLREVLLGKIYLLDESRGK